MPKIKPRPIDEFASRIAKNYISVKGGDPFEKIGKLMRVSGKTAYNRTKDPLRLTLGEMYLLCEAKGVALEEFVSHELKLR